MNITSPTNFKFGAHFLISKSASVDAPQPLEKMKTAIVGSDRIFEMTNGVFREAQIEFDRYHTQIDLLESLGRTSVYQPVLCVLGIDDALEMDVSKCLEVLSNHLLVKLILVAGANGRDSVNPSLQNPCLPVHLVRLPKEIDELNWQVDDFVYKSLQLAINTKRLLRFSSLNARESRIAEYISRGLPNKKICRLLGVSEKTIEKCRKETYEKLGVCSGPELASLVTLLNHFRWPIGVAYPTR